MATTKSKKKAKVLKTKPKAKQKAPKKAVSKKVNKKIKLPSTKKAVKTVSKVVNSASKPDKKKVEPKKIKVEKTKKSEPKKAESKKSEPKKKNTSTPPVKAKTKKNDSGNSADVEVKSETVTNDTNDGGVPKSNEVVKWDAERVFHIKENRKFLNGFISMQENTSLKRISDTEYQVASFNKDGSLAYNQPMNFANGRTAEEGLEICDDFYLELSEMDDLAKKDKKTDEGQNADNSVKDIEGVPLSELDLKEIAKSLPEAPSTTVPSTQPVQPFPNPFASSIFINQMTAYAESIMHNINETFQVRVRGGLSMEELKDTLNNCSKEYQYDVNHEDSKGYYINMRREDSVIRIPLDGSKYLPVK